MAEYATPVSRSRGAGHDGPSIDDLLKTGTFHQRLAAARAARERILAARGETTEPQFLPGPKPWERPEYLRGELRKARREAPPKVTTRMITPVIERATIPATEVAEVPSAPVVPLPVSAVAKAVPETTSAVATGAWRPRLYQLAGGVAFGVAVGVGMGYWFARAPQPKAAATVSIAAEGPAVTAPDAVAMADRVAVPAPDLLPPSPDTPHLSHVTYLSAALPEITGGGPVGPQMATAPADAPASFALPESAAPAPALAPAPTPEHTTGPGLAAGAPELGFRAPTVPLPVAVTVPRAALPEVTQGATLPALPEIQSLPVSLTMPEPADPWAGPGDVPLASQASPLHVGRPAPVDGLTLLVHAPMTVTEAEIATASEAFESAGFGAISPKTVDFNVKKTNVRYYSPADREVAELLAEALGAQLRDFTDFSPKPPGRTIEVWLEGRGSGSAAPKVSAKTSKSKKARAAAAGPSQVQILKDRLVRQLRAGALN